MNKIFAVLLLVLVSLTAVYSQNTDSAGDLPVTQFGDGVGGIKLKANEYQGVTYYAFGGLYHGRPVLVLYAPVAPAICAVSVANGPLMILPAAAMDLMDGGKEPVTVTLVECWSNNTATMATGHSGCSQQAAVAAACVQALETYYQQTAAGLLPVECPEE